jgi:hypothetical protein
MRLPLIYSKIHVSYTLPKYGFRVVNMASHGSRCVVWVKQLAIILLKKAIMMFEKLVTLELKNLEESL